VDDHRTLESYLIPTLIDWLDDEPHGPCLTVEYLQGAAASRDTSFTSLRFRFDLICWILER